MSREEVAGKGDMGTQGIGESADEQVDILHPAGPQGRTPGGGIINRESKVQIGFSYRLAVGFGQVTLVIDLSGYAGKTLSSYC